MLTLEDRSKTSWCYWNTDFVQLALSRASTCCSSDSNKGRLVLRMRNFRKPNPTPKSSSSPNEADNQPTIKTWMQNSFHKFSCQSSLLLKEWGVQNPGKQKRAGEEIMKGLFYGRVTARRNIHTVFPTPSSINSDSKDRWSSLKWSNTSKIK